MDKNHGGVGYYLPYGTIQTRDGGYSIACITGDFQEGIYRMMLLKTAVNDEVGVAWTSLTANNITLYRGESDPYWNYVRVRIWVAK